MIVLGQSHVPKIDMVGGVLYLNLGSAGPAAFQAADHACDARGHAIGNPGSWTRLNAPRQRKFTAEQEAGEAVGLAIRT